MQKSIARFAGTGFSHRMGQLLDSNLIAYFECGTSYSKLIDIGVDGKLLDFLGAKKDRKYFSQFITTFAGNTWILDEFFFMSRCTDISYADISYNQKDGERCRFD